MTQIAAPVFHIGDRRLKDFHAKYTYMKQKMESLQKLTDELELQLKIHKQTLQNLQQSLHIMEKEMAKAIS
jgi:hypothetical protein